MKDIVSKSPHIVNPKQAIVDSSRALSPTNLCVIPSAVSSLKIIGPVPSPVTPLLITVEAIATNIIGHNMPVSCIGDLHVSINLDLSWHPVIDKVVTIYINVPHNKAPIVPIGIDFCGVFKLPEPLDPASIPPNPGKMMEKV
jgi:hypothetical protein